MGDRIIVIKLVSEEGIIHIISAYAPQAELDESAKSQIWEEMEGLLQEILAIEKIFLRGDLNGNVGATILLTFLCMKLDSLGPTIKRFQQ